VWVIGSDDNYLDSPVRVPSVVLAPGERADILVDFTGLAGRNVTVRNDAPVPFPDGVWPVPHPVPDGAGGVVIAPADQPWMANVMRFQVTEALRGTDASCNPAAGGCGRTRPMIRLSDANGSLAAGVRIDKTRQLVLKEVMGPGGPVMVLVNNTLFDGMMSAGTAGDFAASMGVTELPRVGSTELWEIANLTMDTHPIHTHLVQFQILNRQAFSQDEADPTAGYPGAWAAAFGTGPVALPAGCVAGDVCPGYGPPLPYGLPNADGALGGNPAFSPYLVGSPAPPDAWESGWKDTAKMHPGEVTRILVRYSPTDSKVASAQPGVNLFSFNPTKGPGYVWHCHIVDHEDNEMMRPFSVVK
jgi:FtsP/CotA-like multicopper oxidase with cupredoxin domain